MSNAHHRKKDPAQVRMQLIESAKRLAFAHGLAGVSVEAVAADAGVTKGGLFYHFANKQELIDAVFQSALNDLQIALETHLEADPQPYGRFTRAWVALAFEGADIQWGPLWMASLTDPLLCDIWGTWFNEQVAQYKEDTPQLETVRFAADGIWLGQLVGITSKNREKLRCNLIEMTKLQV